MSISVTENLVLNKNFKIDEVHITGISSDKHFARISFVVLDNAGKRIGTEYLDYTKEEYNEFWTDFNSGKYLYDLLKAKKELDVVIPDSVEDEFLFSEPELEAPEAMGFVSSQKEAESAKESFIDSSKVVELASKDYSALKTGALAVGSAVAGALANYFLS